MSSSSDVNFIGFLNNVSFQINRYLGIFIFLFGAIGNIGNILVLSQKPLRSNPCTWLFLISSISSLMTVLAGVTPRFLSTWSADLTNTNQFLCKLRIFIVFDSITIAFWLIMLATVDRWLSSSINANRRRMSTLKNAQRGAILIVIVSSAIQIQQLFCFEANLTYTPIKCYSKTIICGIISDLCFALITILCPLILMFIFGLMIISNIRQARARLQPTLMTIDSQAASATTTVGGGNQNQERKTDRHLLTMLFVQVLSLLIFTLPLAISKLYTTVTRETVKSALQNSTENFTFNLFLLFIFIASGMPFYLYTLSGGHVFRKALFALMEIFIRKLICRRD
ncbi:hypothetical protein I4U23_004493 [Adineta vaga]|nr:hypothetical protein I4U23_004493 [Adineta vaga]